MCDRKAKEGSLVGHVHLLALLAEITTSPRTPGTCREVASPSIDGADFPTVRDHSFWYQMASSSLKALTAP